MNLVLFALRDNLLAASQSVILLSSAFKECSTFGILLISQKRGVSSAYMIILNMSVHNGKSLIYTENRKGPNTDPDGIPVLISKLSDWKPLYSTTCCLCVR